MRRFSNTAAYDPLLDIYNSKEGRARLAIFKNAPLYKKELWRSKADTTRKKNAAPKIALVADTCRQREEAEQSAADTIVAAVTAIQHVLALLQSVPAPRQYRKMLNAQAVHNAVFRLRNKCGITFPPDQEYSGPITLDRAHLGGRGGADPNNTD